MDVSSGLNCARRGGGWTLFGFQGGAIVKDRGGVRSLSGVVPRWWRVGAALGIMAFVLVPPSVLRGQEMSYRQWVQRCLSAPSNRTLNGRFPTQAQLPLSNLRQLNQLLARVVTMYRQGALANKANWVGSGPNPLEFFDTNRSYYTRSAIPFQPFSQKFTATPGAEFIFHGDFHGDIRSFIATLEWLNESGRMEGFRLKSRQRYLVFLGDYTDRGAYGVEVLYTLFRLAIENPGQVLMARGNHEDFLLTANYGFLHEVRAKYGADTNPLPIWRMFDFLPVVIYVGVGTDYVQCNHGGMEPGYDPLELLNAPGAGRYQLLGEITRRGFQQSHPKWVSPVDTRTRQLLAARMRDFRPQTPTSPQSIGFMWSDYSLFKDDPALGYNPNRMAFVFGESTTSYLLRTASRGRAQLHAVFRAHQHSSAPNPMMNRLVVSRGAFRHWQPGDSSRQANAQGAILKGLVETGRVRRVPEGSVWTWNVAPDSVYGRGNGYTFDTIGILKTAAAFSQWNLEVVNIPVKVD